MRFIFIYSLIFIYFFKGASVRADLSAQIADRVTVEQDLQLILQESKLPNGLIQLGKVTFLPSGGNHVVADCSKPGVMRLNIYAEKQEWSSTFYWGIHHLGFLFPHPRMQLNPGAQQLMGHCGQTWGWQPRFLQRGFHLHTEHPNEWVKGFLEGDREIAVDFIRWLARNEQNIFEVVLLRDISKENLSRFFDFPFHLAHNFGILNGISVSIEMQQQKSAHLVDPRVFETFFWPKHSLDQKLKEILLSIHEYVQVHPIDFDFMSVDMGTTEFTHPSFDSELQLIEGIRKSLELYQKTLFVKVHASMNQFDPSYGQLNFNFLPGLADPRVGVLPHTLMFYGLSDEKAPMYGRKNFSDMLDFMVKQAPIRPTWYYPETSYWVGLDQDIPLLLTDYLLARSTDMDLAQSAGVQGHLTFTSGQGLGYWLFDWTVTLLSSQEYAHDPLIGIKLLGESEEVWQREVDFQHRFFKKNGMISMLDSANLMDELPRPFQEKVHSRHTIPELSRDRRILEAEISQLEVAAEVIPDVSAIRFPELRELLRVTHLRIHHALAIRQALFHLRDDEKEIYLTQAYEFRNHALGIMAALVIDYNPYPSAHVFDEFLPNPTSYAFGYLWPARVLHFWEREEKMISEENFDSPFFMNIFNPFSIIF